MKYVATIEGREYLVEIIDEHHLSVNGVAYEVDFTAISEQPVYSALINNASHEANVLLDEDTWQVLLHGTLYQVQVEDEREKRLRATAGSNIILTGDTPIKSPMPGLVVAVQVVDGQTVAKGDTLVILESMKMQNELCSPRDGIVTRLKAVAGQTVERNQLLCYVGKN